MFNPKLCSSNLKPYYYRTLYQVLCFVPKILLSKAALNSDKCTLSLSMSSHELAAAPLRLELTELKRHIILYPTVWKNGLYIIVYYSKANYMILDLITSKHHCIMLPERVQQILCYWKIYLLQALLKSERVKWSTGKNP